MCHFYVFTFPRAAADGLSSCTYGGALEEPNWKPTHFTRWVHWKFERIQKINDTFILTSKPSSVTCF